MQESRTTKTREVCCLEPCVTTQGHERGRNDCGRSQHQALCWFIIEKGAENLGVCAGFIKARTRDKGTYGLFERFQQGTRESISS
jgi:hypothetical protein